MRGYFDIISSRGEVIMKENKTRDVVYIGIFAAIIAVCSWIAVPAAVPFTLQTMGVFTAVGILGGKRGTLAVLTYILLGVVGLPVFAGFSGGIGAVLGASGGYIIGFLFSALIMWGMEKIFGNGKVVLAVSMVLGLVACYAVGTVWFMAVYTKNTGAVGLGTVLGWCVIPFIIPDLVKIAVSLILTNRLKKIVK